MRKLLRAARLGEDRVRQILHLHQSPLKREVAAQRFWSRPPEAKTSFWWHLRGGSAYSDEQWLAIGRRHVELYRRLAGADAAPKKVIEWGCGGGANAVAFGQGATDFYGVEVSQPSLDECGKQMADLAPTTRFHPVTIDVAKPEAATEKIPRDCDLFTSFYVFEVFPSQAYGQRVLKAALAMLRPGGHAFVQVKYSTDAWHTRSRQWGYTRGVANMTTYRVDQFWTLSQEAGFTPISLTLVPKPEEVPDERYAYYLLRKP